MNSDTLHRLTQAASEAAHAPAVKLSAGASTVVVGSDWLASGPGIVAVLGIGLTAATFLVNVWAAWRRDRREQALAEAKLRAIEATGQDETEPLPLESLPRSSRTRHD